MTKLNSSNKILKFITNPTTKLLLIPFFALYLPAKLYWPVESFSQVIAEQSRVNSIIVMSILFLVNFILNHKFFRHLRSLNFNYILPIYILLSGILFSALMIIREPYSLAYLIPSWLVMLGLFLLYGILENYTHQNTIAYIDEGNINELLQISHVHWLKLEKPNFTNKLKFDFVVADLRADLSDEWQKFLAQCSLKQIPVYHSSSLFEILTGRVKINHLYENNLGSLLPSKNYQIIKRILESALIIVTFPITLPIMLITAIGIKLESPGDVMFLQKRVGQGGKEFTIYKFRSMCKDSEKDGSQFAQANDMRVTRIGKFIRKVRIDELPQFFNVLKGDMALIGPRPEQKSFVDEFDKIIPFYSYRHIVKPGISGWAQVTQGYTADADESRIKLEYDFYYIKNFSFSMDLLIVFKTLITMMTGFGAR